MFKRFDRGGRRVLRSLVFGLVSCSGFLRADLASADGGIFFARAGVGYSADQKAIVLIDETSGRETLVLHTDRDWLAPEDQTDYAWVVPTPSRVDRDDFKTLLGGGQLFRRLQDRTEPQGMITSGGGPLLGCGGGAGGDGARAEPASAVDEISAFQVEDYEVHVLSAAESEALQQWLAERGYHLPPDADAVLQDYIDRGWLFCAVKVRMPPPGEAGTGSAGEVRHLDPLMITFEADPAVFPLLISSTSSRSDERTEVLLYVLAAHRMEIQGFETLEMTSIYRDFGSTREFRAYYAEEFDRRLVEAGGRAFVVEFAGIVSARELGLTLADAAPSYFVTRLRSLLPANLMDSDLELVPAPTDDPFSISASSNVPVQRCAWASVFAALCLCSAILFRGPGTRWAGMARKILPPALVLTLLLL